jgi:dipeptidyl aminopeptidase/acylaminoacyl peptidase
LLIHGLKDKLWKAERSKRLERRLKTAGKHVETLYMANEGHIPSMLAVTASDAALHLPELQRAFPRRQS